MAYLGAIPLLRKTFGMTTWAGGVNVTEQDGTDQPFTGTWRPLPAAQVQQLEEGDRLREPKALVTDQFLQVANPHKQRDADWVSPDSGTTWYEVFSEADSHAVPGFGAGVIHYKYTLLRKQEQEGNP